MPGCGAARGLCGWAGAACSACSAHTCPVRPHDCEHCGLHPPQCPPRPAGPVPQFPPPCFPRTGCVKRLPGCEQELDLALRHVPSTANQPPRARVGLKGDGVRWGVWGWVSSGAGWEGNDVPRAGFGALPSVEGSPGWVLVRGEQNGVRERDGEDGNGDRDGVGVGLVGVTWGSGCAWGHRGAIQPASLAAGYK